MKARQFLAACLLFDLVLSGIEAGEDASRLDLELSS
jgi:hypothetical protein